MNPERLRWLKAIPLFGALRDDTLEFLLSRTTSRVVPAAELFFDQDELGESMFVLEQGRVKVERDFQGYRHLLAELARGDCFGEMALIECAPRCARVEALEDCAAFELAFDTLHQLYDSDREQFVLMQMNMARELSRRLRRAGELLTAAQAEINAQQVYGIYM